MQGLFVDWKVQLSEKLSVKWERKVIESHSQDVNYRHFRLLSCKVLAFKDLLSTESLTHRNTPRVAKHEENKKLQAEQHNYDELFLFISLNSEKRERPQL